MKHDGAGKTIQQVSVLFQSQSDRIEAEIAFAESLCDLYPSRARAWRRLIRSARTCVRRGVESGSLESLSRAVRDAEGILAPMAGTAKSYTVHCVGHAHIDMNWMWSWPETVAVTVDTVTTVLRLMEEYPAFTFSQSQASIYAILDEYRSDLLAQVAARVREGRWEVTASHWVEGDKNLAGGESLCRHILWTRAYMRDRFGLKPEDVPIDWSPDTFGFPVTTPTYLARGGVRFLYLHRPGMYTADKPPLFWWEGPDGSRVLVRNDMKLGYNGVVRPEVARCLARYVAETGLHDMMFVYGVGDHGGGPTRRDIENLVDMARWPVFPTLRFSTVRQAFEAVAQTRARLPVIRTELNTEFAGCYTSQSLIKKTNRFGENRLLDAETAGVLAWLAAGHPYPQAAFRDAWRNHLFSHFHDILPGSGVMDTRTYTHGLYQKTVAMAGQALTHAFRTLASRVNTTAGIPRAELSDLSSVRRTNSIGSGVGFASGEGAVSLADQSTGRAIRPYVLFNTTPNDRREIVELTVWDRPEGAERPLKSRSFTVRDARGQARAGQPVNSGHFWGHDFVTLAVPAHVPGLGYTVCTVSEDDTGSAPPAATAVRHIGREHHCSYSLPELSREGLENEWTRVEIDPVAGGILRLTDRRSGVDLVAATSPVPVLEYLVERPHAMSSWLIQHPGQPPEMPALIHLKRTLKGPYVASLEAKFRIRESDFTVTYSLRSGDPRLHVGIRGTWFQRGTAETGIPALRFSLPTNLQNARARYEVPFGAVDRSFVDGEEVPALQWAQVTGRAGRRPAGCILFNDCKHGHSLKGRTLRLTLIRGSYEPDTLPDIHDHEIRLAILPFVGRMDVPTAMRMAQEFNRGLHVAATDLHRGTLSGEGCWIRVTPGAVVLSGIKKAEDGEAVVVRLVNPSGRAVKARVLFDKAVRSGLRSAVEVDLMERPVKKSTARVRGAAVTVTIPSYGMASVQVAFRG